MIKHRLRRAALLTAGLLLCSLGTACGQDSQNSGANSSFTYLLTQNPKSLDPQLAEDEASLVLISNLFEGLFTLDDSGNVQCAAAESWTVSEDCLTYTIQLRTDNYWNRKDEDEDAEPVPVCASDFVYAFRRIFNPEYGSPYRERFLCLENAQAIYDRKMDYTMLGVYAHNQTELVFQLDEANPEFLTLLTTTAAMPCNQEFFESTKGRYGLDEDSVLGNGPFCLTMWFYDAYGSHNEIYLERSDRNSKADRVYPSNLIFPIQDKEDDPEAMMKEETVDCLLTKQHSWRTESGYTADASYSMTLGLLANPEDPYYSNAEIRTALALGLEREACGASGDLEPAWGLIPPSVSLSGKSYREMAPDSVLCKEDAAAAKAAFSQGLGSLGIANLPSAQILVPSGWTDYAYLRTLTRQWESLFGVYISMEEVSESEYESRLASGDYTLALYALSGSYNSPTAVLEQFLQDPMLSCEEEQLKAVLKRLSGQTKLSDSLSVYQEAEALLLDSWDFIPLFYKAEYLIYRPSNTDLRFDPYTNAVLFRYAKHFD